MLIRVAGNMIRKHWLSLIFFLCGLISILVACSDDRSSAKASSHTSVRAVFVDQAQCASCHQAESHDWHGSHHDLAMDVATDVSVLGDFNHATFTAHGVTSTFYRHNGKFFVRTDGRDGKLHDFGISYVFGVDPLQQYLIRFPDGRMQALDIAWDTRPKKDGGQRWFHLHPDEKITPKHPFHWTRRFLNWNYMCAECHSTHVQKNFDLKSNTFKTSWQKIDVGCQACHGPGSEHVAWAKSGDKTAWGNSRGLRADLAAKDSHVQIESCARCHSRRSNVHHGYQAGKSLMDFYVPQVLREPFYYPDGQMKDEVYEYGSFVQSKMYARGVRCTDCHNAHTARLRLKPGRLCVSCHNNKPEKHFAGLKSKDYEKPSHHFHPSGSRGAQCIACHMPAKTYMGVDVRRDHGFRIPRPDLSLKTGAPNACTQCHQHRSDQWAADTLAKWYPASAELYRAQKHFSEVFAAAQSGKPSVQTARALMHVAREKTQAVIIRATAVSLLASFPGMETLNTLNAVLQHRDPLMRYHAVRSIDAMIPQAAGEMMLRRKLRVLAPLLGDAIRAVRTEAARALSDVPPTMFTEQQRAQFHHALDEYLVRQNELADRPEAHLNRGLLYQRMGHLKKAEAAYKIAIRLVPDDVPSRFGLANLYHAQGQSDQAEAMFRKILSIDANNGEAHYSLGLLLAELERFHAAAAELKQAARLLPERPRVRYNYALALKKLGNNHDALTQVQQAVDSETTDAMMVYVLTVWLAEAGRYDEALLWARKLVTLLPGDKGAKGLLEDIGRKVQRH